jgi:hypothetical protein
MFRLVGWDEQRFLLTEQNQCNYDRFVIDSMNKISEEGKNERIG